MASPMFCGFELGSAHSRAGIDEALSWAIVPALYFRTCGSVKPRSEREVVPRKGSEVRNGNHVGHFAVRGRRGRAVGSHSASIPRAIGCDGFNNHWQIGSLSSTLMVVTGSPNKSFKRTPNTPRPAANAFGIVSQQSAPRSAPFN